MLRAYNVPTKNSFAQLDSEAESDEFVPAKKASPEAALAPAPAPTTTASAPRRERPAARPQESRVQDSRVQDSRPQDSRAQNVRQQEIRGPRGPRTDQDRPFRGRGGFRGGRGMAHEIPVDPEEDVVIDTEHPQTRPNRHGNRRFDRGARTSAFRGREFERHDGTGRGREVKKSGAGIYNWGRNRGFAEGVMNATIQDLKETEGQVSGAETPVEGAPEASTSETEKGKEETEEDKYEDFAEWQKKQKQKRAALLQEKMATGVGAGPARAVDATDLEKDGYHLYERDETAEERAARELRMNTGGGKTTESEDEEDSQRPRTYNIFEFTGDYGRRGSRGGRGGRGGARGSRGGERGRPNTPQHPIVLDLHDAAAFPSLLNG